MPANSERSACSRSAGSGSTSTRITAGASCPLKRRTLSKVDLPLHPRHLEHASSEDVRLDGGVRQMVVLGRRGLHLDQAVAGSPTLEDVHGHEDIVGPKRGFVDGRRTRPKRLLCRWEALRVRVVRQVGQESTGNIRPEELANSGSLVHRRGRPLVELEFRRLRLMDHPPEKLVALQPRHESRSRESGPGHRARDITNRARSSRLEPRADRSERLP
jgi:hypothetical protein